MQTMNVLDSDLLKNKVLTKTELKEYGELRISLHDNHKKWLFLHTIQDKITDAIEKGVVSEIEQTISEPQQAHTIRGAN